MQRFYRLDKDYNALDEDDLARGEEFTAWRELYTDYEGYKFIAEANDWDLDGITQLTGALKGLPDRVVFFGYFDLLEKVEMPTNDLHWLIVSRRFVDVLRGLGFADFRLINLRIIELSQFGSVARATRDARRYELDSAVQGMKYSDYLFYGLQLTRRVPLLTEDSDIIGVNPIVRLRDETPSLPPIFRDEWNPLVLVSQQGKDALEAAGIRGISFEEMTPAVGA